MLACGLKIYASCRFSHGYTYCGCRSPTSYTSIVSVLKFGVCLDASVCGGQQYLWNSEMRPDDDGDDSAVEQADEAISLIR
jgi:hypothetical protein